MDIFYLAAVIAVVVALLERNHRRQRLPQAPWGAATDRDLERVRHDLSLAAPHSGDDRPEQSRPESAAGAPASQAGRPLRDASPAVCRAAAS